MECPKCHKSINENETVCPYCHKVLLLECPNCHSFGEKPVCENCGYIILTKCSKCGKTVSVSSDKCKCGFPVKMSIAYNECETDEFASIVLKFGALKSIKHHLGSRSLYQKFYNRLTNLLAIHFKSIDGRVISYNDTFVINMNKELSFPTSADKAVRLALKILNGLSDLNSRVIEEFNIPLKISMTVLKKNAEDLLKMSKFENDVKMLNIKKAQKKYLKGMELILDQFVRDSVEKNYKTDSLYAIEQDGKSLMFYEVLLENYVLPPSQKSEDVPVEVGKNNKKNLVQNELVDDIYSIKIFDINAQCKFVKCSTNNLLNTLESNKIIALKAAENLQIRTSDLVDYYEMQGKQVLHVVCTEAGNYRPWDVFIQLFKEYYNLSYCHNLIPNDSGLNNFEAILDLVSGNPRKASTPEDARFAYMEDFNRFLSSLKNTVILIEGFEYMDDTSIQTFTLYFDKFKKINTQIVFVTSDKLSVHSKIKGLLRTPFYTEYTLLPSNIDVILSSMKADASDFINSFYFEKIKENYDGSFLYYDNALKYLTDKEVFIEFENKLLIKNNNSVIISKDLQGLLKLRLKSLSKDVDASLILAFSTYLGPRLDFNTLSVLGVKEVEKVSQLLEKSGFAYIRKNVLHINNYNLIKPVLERSIKKEVNGYLCKTIVNTIGSGIDITTSMLLLGRLSQFQEEYNLLYKNAQVSMLFGDYDAYMKNCLGFLSLIEQVEGIISPENIEENKKDVYQNIIMNLCRYSPEKIYSIGQLLLVDAIKEDDNDKVIKLSNLMLQGALISSNYTDAMSLLHNILTRMQDPMLTVGGAINTRFLLLSLVNVEVLFNIGNLSKCIEITKDIVNILTPEIIEKIKPANFSVNLFINHLMETFTLTCFAKLFLLDDDLEEFFESIKNALGQDLPDKECILTVREFLAGKEFAPANSENLTPLSKIINLILQEFSEHKNDYKTFAQNIYQAKLLANDIHKNQLELFCDLLIAYAYAKTGIRQKAEAIYSDVLKISEKNAIFNIILLSKYFEACLKISNSEYEEGLTLINGALAMLQKHDNQILFALFNKLYIELIKNQNIRNVDISPEEKKLENLSNKLTALI